MSNRFKKLINAVGSGVSGLLSASGGDAIADNEVVRGDGTTGIQGSIITLGDTGTFTSTANLTITASGGASLALAEDLTPAGWIVNQAGMARLSSPQTVDSVTPGNSGLSVPLKAGHAYIFRCVMFASTPTAADGFRVDFDGGTATATSFRVFGRGFDATGAITASAASSTTALATDIVWTSTTGEALYEFDGHIVVNAAGSFIPRFGKEADAGAAAVLNAGSYLQMWETV